MFWLKTPYSELNLSNCKSVKAGEALNAGEFVLLKKDTNTGVEVAVKPTSAEEAAKVTHIVGIVQNDMGTLDPNGFVTGYKSGEKIQVLNGVEFTVDSASFESGTYNVSDYTGINTGGKIVASGSAVAATGKFLRVQDYKASGDCKLLTLKMDNIF